MIDHYEPHILTAQDYYPFGMLSRVALPGNDKSYTFGFNGKMNNNDVKGGLGNQYMAGYKYISSTEAYAVQNLDTLQDELSKHHPFG